MQLTLELYSAHVKCDAGLRKVSILILYFRIPHNTLLYKLLFSNALGDTAYSQEHLKTMVYAKFGGQTKCIMGNSKIENSRKSLRTPN